MTLECIYGSQQERYVYEFALEWTETAEICIQLVRLVSFLLQLELRGKESTWTLTEASVDDTVYWYKKSLTTSHKEMCIPVKDMYFSSDVELHHWISYCCNKNIRNKFRYFIQIYVVYRLFTITMLEKYTSDFSAW